jgi:hypothetical protein
MSTPTWPHIDRNTSAGVWPIPFASPAEIRETVARAYRTGLLNADPELCARVDAQMIKFGQHWIADHEVRDEPTEEVTTAEAAILACVKETTIRQWACTPHPCIADRMLLPRFGRRGHATTYLVVHVMEAKKTAQTLRLARKSQERRLADQV